MEFWGVLASSIGSGGFPGLSRRKYIRPFIPRLRTKFRAFLICQGIATPVPGYLFFRVGRHMPRKALTPLHNGGAPHLKPGYVSIVDSGRLSTMGLLWCLIGPDDGRLSRKADWFHLLGVACELRSLYKDESAPDVLKTVNC